MNLKSRLAIFTASVGIMVFVILGCGSDTTPGSASGKKGNADVTPLSQKLKGQDKPKIPGEIGPIGVIPPDKFGGPRLTREEVEAMKLKAETAARNVDPSKAMVIPPDKPGGKGVTLEQVNAAKPPPSGKPLDPRTTFVIPPDKPGGKGITLEQVNAAKPSDKPKPDPSLIMVIPPDKPGEPGITLGEINAKKPKQTTTNKEGFLATPSN